MFFLTLTVPRASGHICISWSTFETQNRRASLPCGFSNSNVRLANAILLQQFAASRATYLLLPPWPFSSLPKLSTSQFLASAQSAYHTYYLPSYSSAGINMHAYHLLVLIAFLVGIAQCCIDIRNAATVIAPSTVVDQPEATVQPAQPETTTQEQSEPTVTEAQSEQTQLQLRDIPQNLDYHCGPKWGKCPSGTCCSSAGKLLTRMVEMSLIRTGSQVTVAQPRRTAAPRTA